MLLMLYMDSLGRTVRANLADERSAIVRPASVVARALAVSGSAAVAVAIAVGKTAASSLDTASLEGGL